MQIESAYVDKCAWIIVHHTYIDHWAHIITGTDRVRSLRRSYSIQPLHRITSFYLWLCFFRKILTFI